MNQEKCGVDCNTITQPQISRYKGVKYSLNTVISLANGSWALPEEDVFHPNSNTWAETAKHMGVGKAPKWKPSLTGGNTSTECISPVKGKHTCKYTDPYAAGKRSGKYTKPDAVSAAANEHTRMSVLAPLPLVHSPAHGYPSAVEADSAMHPFTHADQTIVNPLIHMASGTMPGHVLLCFPTTLPSVHSSIHAPPSAIVAGFTACSFTLSN